MQIVIPMSGFGERFRKAGYKLPKALIPVLGRPIISHVTDMFPGDHDFVFICSSQQLQEKAYDLRGALEGLGRRMRIVEIEPHRRGPVPAVLSARRHIRLDEEVVVNYCDFYSNLNFESWRETWLNQNLSASVPAYRGFHPHSGGHTNYAYVRELGLRAAEIREKQPFTRVKTAEFASTGTYFFSSASEMLHYFEEIVKQDLTTAGEFYVSTAIDKMIRDSLPVGVFKVEHFMQWGTPEDFEAFQGWSDLFEKIAAFEPVEPSSKLIRNHDFIVLASGKGQRFLDAGYDLPKAVLDLSGRPMVSQVVSASALQARVAVVGREDQALESFFSAREQLSFVKLARQTRGQAESAFHALKEIKPKGSFTILACDSIQFRMDHGANLDDIGRGVDEIAVWVQKPTDHHSAFPEHFGWISGEFGSIRVTVKNPHPDRDAKVITGHFTFSSHKLFDRLYTKLIENETLVNGEYYLDSLVAIAASSGVKVTLVEAELVVSLGTPFEYESFRYWQRAFDEWRAHPYSLEADPLVSADKIGIVRSGLDRPSLWEEHREEHFLTHLSQHPKPCKDDQFNSSSPEASSDDIRSVETT